MAGITSSVEGSGPENPPALPSPDRGAILAAVQGNLSGGSISTHCNFDGYICHGRMRPIIYHLADAERCELCGRVESWI